MIRLGSHPHIVTVFDLGQENSQPCMFTELIGGGDVEVVIEKTEAHKLSLEQAPRLATCPNLGVHLNSLNSEPVCESHGPFVG